MVNHNDYLDLLESLAYWLIRAKEGNALDAEREVNGTLKDLKEMAGVSDLDQLASWIATRPSRTRPQPATVNQAIQELSSGDLSNWQVDDSTGRISDFLPKDKAD